MLGIRQGSAIAVRVNAHRAGWDGSICRNPASWDCGGTLPFRQDRCERGDPACFHLKLFEERDPGFRIHSSGADWLLERDIHALDDQVLVLYNRPFEEPSGIGNQHSFSWRVYGLYRIESVEKVYIGYRYDWLVRPYHEAWIRLEELKIPLPRYRELSGNYVKEVDRSVLDRIVIEARQVMAERGDLAFDRRTIEQFDDIMDALPGWLEAAAERIEPLTGGQMVRPVAEIGGRPHSSPFDQLAKYMTREDERQTSARITTPAPLASSPIVPGAKVESPLTGSIVEPAMRERIIADYGAGVLRSLEIATMTKPLLILRGGPGVGKSTLASALIDDPTGERSCIVPVSSTWRGREDLLGYVNPMSGKFQVTGFSQFLIAAEKAWDRGDRRFRLVIFEELNLSQPEYWLSDILIRIEYPGLDRHRRTIELGGTGTILPTENERTGVYLTPAIRFVATINTDHTTRKLSPRVLDRAAVIELSVDPATAFERMGINLESDQIEAVQQLDYLVRRKGAAFSYRSARSLQTCLGQRAQLGLEIWEVIDFVVVHEVLSKIHLMAGDSNDAVFMDQALAWHEAYSRWLPQSARMLDSWREALEEGRDVAQA